MDSKLCRFCNILRPVDYFYPKVARCKNCLKDYRDYLAPRCSVDGCSNRRNTGDLCLNHFRRRRRYGDPLSPYRTLGRNIGICSVENCNNRAKSLTFCSSHYHRYQRYGSPVGIAPPKIKTPKKVCSVLKCTNNAVSRTWCRAHYSRWRLSGDVQADRPLLNGSSPTFEYRRVTVKGHFLADAGGRVAEHRLILFEAIGVGIHHCYWCGCEILWEISHPNVNALTVDHLNFERSDNRVENLVPACPSCNSGRHRTTELQGLTYNGRLSRKGAINREKTQCPKGHKYDIVNTGYTKRGRRCKACNREYMRGRTK